MTSAKGRGRAFRVALPLVLLSVLLHASARGECQVAAPASVVRPASKATVQEAVVEEVLGQPGVVVGWIDWTSGTVAAVGKGATQPEAEAAARRALSSVLLVVSVDEAGTVGDRVLANPGYAPPVQALAAKAKIREAKAEGGRWSVQVEASMLGKGGLIAIVLSPPPPLSMATVSPPASTPVVVAAQPAKHPTGNSQPVAAKPVPAQPSDQKKPETARVETLPKAAGPAVTAQKEEAKGPAPAAVASAATPPPQSAETRPAAVPTTQPPANGTAAPAAGENPAATVPATIQPGSITAKPSPTGSPVSEIPLVFTPLNVPSSGPFTGLIIDARGLALQRCISPRIVTQTGKIIYGYWEKMTNDQLDKVRSTGIVGYLISADMALKSRAGMRPMVVRAVGKEGAASGYAIISDADGERILKEEAKSHFLKSWAVAFLIRP